MTKSDHLVAYIEGVKNGDGETILRSLSDSFVLDDPDKGQISKDGFESYFAKFKDTVAYSRGSICRTTDRSQRDCGERGRRRTDRMVLVVCPRHRAARRRPH